MARRWQDGDSARLMTNKYNEAAEEVEYLKQKSTEVNDATQKELDEISKTIAKKAESKSDIGLSKVDNTSDTEKPVSVPQSKAIEEATEEMLTSEPVGDIEGENIVGYLTTVGVTGTKLIISV